MKVASYIPIKFNNVRTPGKNIKEFDDGTPLCQFMFNTIAQVTGIDEKYCFCSSEEIKKYLPEEIRFLKRSEKLDSSSTQCHEIIKEFISLVDADIYVLTHVTCPFVKAETIERCIEKVKSGKYDSAFTAAKIQDFLWKEGKPLNFDPEYAVRTQELETIYKESIGCYVFTKDMFLRSNRKVGFNPYIYEVDAYEEMDIDYPEDFEKCNAVYMNILKSKINCGRKMRHIAITHGGGYKYQAVLSYSCHSEGVAA